MSALDLRRMFPVAQYEMLSDAVRVSAVELTGFRSRGLVFA